MKISSGTSLWSFLTGTPEECTMENRAFNHACIITFLVLVYGLVADVLICISSMLVLFVVLMALLAVVYYFSRFRQQYQVGIIVYAVCNYLVLGINFYTNSGTIGPTICFLLLSFHLLVAVANSRHNVLWITLHFVLLCILLYTEYIHPEWVVNNYPTRSDRFLDIATAYGVTLLLTYFITSFLRRNFNNERKLAEERAAAIAGKNEEIMEKNRYLEEANTEKNKLFSIISHDLRSPLNSIMGYLELLTADAVTASEREEIQAELLNQTKYTSDLMQNLLAWAKSQMEGGQVNIVRMSLNTLIEDTMAYKIAEAAKKNITLTYVLRPGIEVLADMEMLRIVLRNLMNNAIKFTVQGGHIVITTTIDGDEAIIAVADNGLGIDLEKQKKLFTLKTESTMGTGNEKGMGLGLMMCREFATQQNGRIWFNSTLGKGSTFYVALPLAHPH